MDEDEALAIGVAVAGVRHCLFVCGLIDAAAQDAVIAEGFVDMASLAELREKDIHEMVKTINTRTNPLPQAAIPPVAGRGRGRGRGRAIPPNDQEQPIPVILPQIRITRRAARRLGESILG
jgi:hypothetical protein